MSSSWAGISFYTLANNQDNTIARPLLVPDDFGVQETKLPYADQAHVQMTGWGNKKLTLKIEMYSDTDFAALLAKVGKGTPYTLTTEWGESITNMLLTDMKNVWRVSFAEEIHADLTFTKVPGL